MDKRNFAKLSHKNESFYLWQDNNLNWCFSFQNLENVNTGTKDLQPALNSIYESIDDKLRPMPKKRKEHKGKFNNYDNKKRPENILDRLGP